MQINGELKVQLNVQVNVQVKVQVNVQVKVQVNVQVIVQLKVKIPCGLPPPFAYLSNGHGLDPPSSTLGGLNPPFKYKYMAVN